MKVLLLSLVLHGLTYQVWGETCYSCSDSNYDGEPSNVGNCFVTIAAGQSGATTDATCAGDTAGTVINYCRTAFTIVDGVVTAVERGCVASTGDEDTNTVSVPSTNKCVTTLATGTNPTDRTLCYYHCTTDFCNTVTTSSLIPCSTDCNIGNGGGRCNYITGTCVCNAGFSGGDCTTTTTTTTTGAARSCVQCNSLVDTGCATSTTSVACPGAQTYCSTATTAIYDSSDSVIRTVVTRGCAATFTAIDECSFTNIFTDSPISDSSVGYNEFTCYSTCDTDGCNTNSADGVLNGNEAVVLQCVQCSDTTGSGFCNFRTARTPCPSSSTHCKSTVTYLISNRTDLSYSDATPAYKLVSNVRECTTAAETTQCTTKGIGSLSLAKVTCTETCQTDGCNTGWPARPKCLQCSSSTSDFADGFDRCVENPTAAAVCTYPYEEYCITREGGIEKGTGKTVAGYPYSITRACSHIGIGTGCSETTIRSTAIESCNRTCSTDGCNVGGGSSMPLQTMAALMTPLIMGWLAQHF